MVRGELENMTKTIEVIYEDNVSALSNQSRVSRNMTG